MSRFLETPEIAAFSTLFGTTVVKATVDAVLRDVRRSEPDGAGVPAFGDLVARASAALSRVEMDELASVLNGTGVLLHTNLGRAPLASEAVAAVAAVAAGYSNLEFELESGSRVSRYGRVSTLLRETTGTEDALVVNNCAAAVLLILDTFGKGRDVIVSRNQLIEIGGGFRLPEVLARSGARLVEVGATNKVYLRDFERALTADTALLLRSHTSNYRIDGFTADVAPSEFAALGARVGVPAVEDLGGGALVDLEPYGLPHERTVREALADGLDLVAFSGDKLLGGPQCGIVAGRAAAIARLRSNPLLRALRVDKATLAALAATLRLYLKPSDVRRIPFYAMLGCSRDELVRRASDLVASLSAVVAGRASARGVETVAYAGGGSAPLAKLPSYGVALRAGGRSANDVAARLRVSRPHVIARIEAGEVVIDLRTIPADRDADVTGAIVRALA